MPEQKKPSQDPLREKREQSARQAVNEIDREAIKKLFPKQIVNKIEEDAGLKPKKPHG